MASDGLWILSRVRFAYPISSLLFSSIFHSHSHSVFHQVTKSTRLASVRKNRENPTPGSLPFHQGWMPRRETPGVLFKELLYAQSERERETSELHSLFSLNEREEWNEKRGPNEAKEMKPGSLNLKTQLAIHYITRSQ